MLECGHERVPFREPMCVHMRSAREPWLKYVMWYTGVGLESELVCESCSGEREEGKSTSVGLVCEECFEHVTSELCYQVRVGGKPEIRLRADPFNTSLIATSIPKEIGNF